MTTPARRQAAQVGAQYEAALLRHVESVADEVRAFDAWKLAAETLGVGHPDAVEARQVWHEASRRTDSEAQSASTLAELLARCLQAVETEGAPSA